MNVRELGRTGVNIPEVGLGMWKYGGGHELLRHGIEAGAAFIDTAEAYGNEEVAGRAIKGLRERVFVATKTSRHRPKEIFQAADNSLRLLGIDRIDLYQIHYPNATVPIEETMGAMEELVDQGKVRFIGVSNFTLREFKKAQAALRKHRIQSNQVQYSLVERTIETQLLPYCIQNGVTVIAYSPLANSFQKLLGADSKNALRKIAQETNRTEAQVALNWCLLKLGVVVIPKTESIQHAVENCGASGWRLTKQQADILDQAIQFRRRSPLEVSLRRIVRSALQKARRH